MEFEWDEAKAESNLKKHGISFDDGAEALQDKHVVIYEDARRDYGELRWVGTGNSHEGVLTVVFTRRDDRTRIISARKANTDERHDYSHHSQDV